MENLYVLIALICGLGLGGFIVYRFKKIEAQKLDNTAKQIADKELAKTNALVERNRGALSELIGEIYSRTQELENIIKQETAVVETVLAREKDQAREAFSAYVETLEFSMTETEAEFDAKIAALRQELDKITSTRNATIAAVMREKEIQEQSDFYRISVTDGDLADIEILEAIKPKLRKPEVLSKLIWTTFYQKGTTTLCNYVLGEKTVCGVYKITDTTTGLAYIGQSVDIAKRWKDHVKAALGAAGGAISNNKLYAAMRSSGVHNFTFELIEEAPSPQLNEKEKYYIELYQSSVYGLNVTKGNTTTK